MSIAKLAIWDLTGRVANYFVIFIISVILTRLLSPSEFGAYGIVLSVISLSAIFVDLGFRSAIIQARETSQEQLSTIFFINLVIAGLLILLFSSFSGLIESFYQIEGLRNYIVFASLLFALNALALIPSGLLQKNLELKTISIINTVTALLSGIIAVSFAYYGYKVWALIIQQLANAALSLLGFAYFARWLPSFCFDLPSIKKLWQYGSKLLLSGILDTTFTRLDVFIIGKLFPIQTLGYYNRAQALDNLVRSFSASTTTSVAFPLIAKMSDDIDKTRKFYVMCLNIIAFLSFLLIGVLFLTCFDIVIILFTEKWLIVGNYFRIMSVTGFVFPVSALMVNIISARGNSKAFLRLEIIKKCILFPTYLSFFFGGIYFFLVVFGAAFLLALIANAIFVEKEISVSLKRQLGIIFKYGAVAVSSTAIVFGLTFYLENIYLHLIISSVLFAAFYLLLSYKLRFSGFSEIYNRILNLYNDKRHANTSVAA